MSGFTTGAAMSIGLSQINNAFGFNGKTMYVYGVFVDRVGCPVLTDPFPPSLLKPLLPLLPLRVSTAACQLHPCEAR